MGLRTWLGFKKPRKTIYEATEAAQWFAGKRFTADWFSRSAHHWLAPLASLRDRPTEYLEIGTYEGRASVFIAEYMPLANLTCVDVWVNSAAEERFDFNVAPYGKRIRKIKARSVSALDRLKTEGLTFDVIYIDGNHSRHSVFSDTVLAWNLLKQGGLIIWDDYKWGRGGPPEARPQHAIDLFLDVFGDCLTVHHVGRQVLASKTAEWPARFNDFGAGANRKFAGLGRAS